MSCKTVLIAVLCLLSVPNITCSAQKEVLLGRYSNDFGTTIVLDSTYIVVLSRDYGKFWCVSDTGRVTDTIAVCSWKVVADNFIRIDSQPPYERVQESFFSRKSFDPILSRDSIKINFSLAVEEIPVEIQLYDYSKNKDGVNKTFSYSENNRSVVCCDSVLVCIMPLSRPLNLAIIESMPESFLLPPDFSLPLLSIATHGERWNTIDVIIPCLTDSFFEQAWIIGEYIQVTEKGLIWHGDLFSPRKGS